MADSKNIYKGEYKGVRIEEKINIPKTGTYFEAYISCHSDSTVPKMNIISSSLEDVKNDIDSRLKELGIKKIGRKRKYRRF